MAKTKTFVPAYFCSHLRLMNHQPTANGTANCAGNVTVTVPKPRPNSRYIAMAPIAA